VNILTNPYRGRPANGTLQLKPSEISPRVTTADFVPEPTALRAAGVRESVGPLKIAEIDPDSRRLRIFPLNTMPRAGSFLKPKYKKVRCLEVPIPDVLVDEYENAFESMLENLPRGFTKDYQYGLGFPRDYQAFIDAVEELTDCTTISFETDRASAVEDRVLRLHLAEFQVIRAELDRITGRAQAAARRVKYAHSHNALAALANVPLIAYRRGRHPIVQLLTDEAANQPNFNSDEFEALVELAIGQTESVANQRPEMILRLRESVELASLDVLLSKFSTLIARKVSEGTWQRFLRWNPLVLHLALGFPMLLVQEQASVGGRRLSGHGEKLADFLVKNSLTDNLAIVEIKKASTALTSRSYYRDGLYGPSTELAGGVNQVLDQRYQLLKSLSLYKDSSRIYDIEQYAVQCCLIIGATEDDFDRRKSFELFRGNLHGVTVVTYNEILVRLKMLRDLLNEER
jgi:hypothetical protein